jgi:uncharacterized Fe-S cluster-containing MiaB family protein
MFKQMLLDNPEFNEEIKTAILNKIKQSDDVQEVIEDPL